MSGRLAFSLVLITFLATQVCQAQAKKEQTIWAFAKPILYGKELRGLDGNTITRNDTALFFYLKIKGNKKPEITSVSFRKQHYTSSVLEVKEKEIKAGITAATGKAIVIKKTNGYSLWMVELQPDENNRPTASVSDKMIIRGKANGKAFTLIVSKPVLLESDIVG